MTVYDYVVIYHPTKKQREKESQKPELVAGGRLLAKDNNGALMLLSRELDDKWMEHPERLEIKIRPFDGGAEDAPEEIEDDEEETGYLRTIRVVDHQDARNCFAGAQTSLGQPMNLHPHWGQMSGATRTVGVTWAAPAGTTSSITGDKLLSLTEPKE